MSEGVSEPYLGLPFCPVNFWLVVLHCVPDPEILPRLTVSSGFSSSSGIASKRSELPSISSSSDDEPGLSRVAEGAALAELLPAAFDEVTISG